MKTTTMQSTLSQWYLNMRANMGEHILLSLAVFLLPLLLMLGIWGYYLKASLSAPSKTQEQTMLRIQEEAFSRSREKLLRAEQDIQDPFSGPARDIFREQ